MDCNHCGKKIYYTPRDILSQAHKSGFFVCKFDYCVEAFNARFPDANAGRIILNYRILKEALGHYICDMDRLTSFRGMPYSDEHKKAAYLIKWIAKCKPIHMVVTQSQTNADPAYSVGEALANELYAVWLGFTELSVPPADIPQHYTKNLIYLLHYHSIDADCLASELFLLDVSYAPRYKPGLVVPHTGYYAELTPQEEKIRFWGFNAGERFPISTPECAFKLVVRKKRIENSGPLAKKLPSTQSIL